jgi:geranylgeranyl diphosphate synthase type II
MNKSLNELKKLFSAYLDEQKFTGGPEELYAPNNYILEHGGKRLRALLVLMGCELMGRDASEALPAALAVEYFHNYTLIHDDIMDKAHIRRGRETVHVKYGTNAAILSGDVLLIYAYHYLNQYDARLTKQLLTILNRTAIEVCEGQSMDMSFEMRSDVGEDEYLEMIRMKTSVLLAAALKFGALIGGATEKEADLLYSYGENLGLAFQMQDDLLDTYGGDQVGKKIGGDILQNKKTLLLIRALAVEKQLGRSDLTQWLSARERDEEKIAAVKKLYAEFGAKEYVSEKRDDYVKASLEALERIEHDHSALKDLADLLVYRNF